MKKKLESFTGSNPPSCSRSSETPETDEMSSMRRATSEWIALSAKLERERNNLLTAMREIVACGLNCKDALDEAEQMEWIAKQALLPENV